MPSRLSLPITLLALAACAADPYAAPPEETSVKEGINDAFLAPDAKIEPWVERFEDSERREIARCRDAIAGALGIEAGQALADVGAGTGLFLEPFAAAVGESGRVYAVDISAPMIAHMDARIAAAGWPQVATVLCDERSTGLASRSVDLVFVCDTYHHFEFPRHSLASIRQALRPGGRLAIVDFERDPADPWTMEHVRAGKDEVIAEIEAAGFELLGEPAIEGLRRNYLLLFRRR